MESTSFIMFNSYKTFCYLVFAILIQHSETTGVPNFRWKNNAVRETTFYEHLQKTAKSTDIFYVFTGDTQYWYDCTDENENCLKKTNGSTCAGTAEHIKHCQKLQGEYANIVQRKSITDLSKLTKVTGLVLNGDLVMFGNQSEIERLSEHWLNYWTFKVYPGLGNHDYKNNINQCPDQDCVNRILKYFINYVENTLKFSMDYETKNDSVLHKEVITGSLSYSWDECFNTVCFHFVQLNYYPFYSKVIDSKKIKWKIQPSMTWLELDLRKHAHKPVVINFHGIDYTFDESNKLEFFHFLYRMKNIVNVLAITFAHTHERCGVKEVWCYDHGTTEIPLVYAGSVPANNYMLVQLSTETRNIKNMYKIHVKNDDESVVEILNVHQNCSLILNSGGSKSWPTIRVFHDVIFVQIWPRL